MVEMSEVFEKLRSLQDVLSEKYVLQDKIEKTPEQLENQIAAVDSYKKDVVKYNKDYEDIKAVVSKLKVDLAEVEAAREKSEKSMDNISTHREYEALEKEIKDATEKSYELRKSLEIEEKKLADTDAEFKKAETGLREAESELENMKNSLDNEVTDYKDKLNSLESEEAALSEGIDSEIIFKFKRIVKSKHNKGIVAVKGNVCDGCHMILPAQFANDVHSGEKIVFCPYCSRILYYQDVEGEEEQYYQIEDTGSLVDLDDDFDDEYDEDDEDDSEDKEVIKELDF